MRDLSVAHVKVVLHNSGDVRARDRYLSFFLDDFLDLSSSVNATFFELLDSIECQLEL